MTKKKPSLSHTTGSIPIVMWNPRIKARAERAANQSGRAVEQEYALILIAATARRQGAKMTRKKMANGALEIRITPRKSSRR